VSSPRVRTAKNEGEREVGCIAPPKAFVLELTNHCNLRCVMCNFHSAVVTKKREKGFMSLPLARRLLDEISKMSGESKPWVALHGAGESLLHKDFVSILRYASSHSNLDAGFLTNAVLLDRSRAEEVLDTGISWIGFSIDGNDKDKFNRYRLGAEYDRVVGNALEFIELSRIRRPDLLISVNMTLQEDMKGDVPAFVEFWLQHADKVSISPVRPVGSRINRLAQEGAPVARIPCYMLYDMMVISWNGKAPLCCEDWFLDWPLGDTSLHDLGSIWEGEGYMTARSLHEKGDFDRIPLCASCNSWHNALPEIFTDEKLGYSVTKIAWQHEYRKNR